MEEAHQPPIQLYMEDDSLSLSTYTHTHIHTHTHTHTHTERVFHDFRA